MIPTEPSSDERIAAVEVGKAAEVSIGGPELADAMVQAETRHARIMDRRADGL
jgi:hypothetical protein